MTVTLSWQPHMPTPSQQDQLFLETKASLGIRVGEYRTGLALHAWHTLLHPESAEHWRVLVVCAGLSDAEARRRLDVLALESSEHFSVMARPQPSGPPSSLQLQFSNVKGMRSMTGIVLPQLPELTREEVGFLPTCHQLSNAALAPRPAVTAVSLGITALPHAGASAC